MQRPRIAVPCPTSFDEAYNARCWPMYDHALRSCGAEVVAISLEVSPALVADLASSCQGILLPGSPADVNPQKYGEKSGSRTAPPDLPRENVDELLLQDAHNLEKPILGICYGLQSLNVWRGGTLVQDLLPSRANHGAGPDLPIAHALAVAPASILAGTFSAAIGGGTDQPSPQVNSSHHQAVLIPGDKLHVTASSGEDGVTEALEGWQVEGRGANHFVVGVQWHPERSFDFDPASAALMRQFVNACATWVPRTIAVSVAG